MENLLTEEIRTDAVDRTTKGTLEEQIRDVFAPGELTDQLLSIATFLCDASHIENNSKLTNTVLLLLRVSMENDL